MHIIISNFLYSSAYNRTFIDIRDEYHDNKATERVYTAMWQLVLAMLVKGVLTIFTFGMKVRSDC